MTECRNIFMNEFVSFVMCLCAGRETELRVCEREEEEWIYERRCEETEERKMEMRSGSVVSG